MNGAEKATGFAVGGAASGGLAWLTYPNIWSFLAFVGALAAAGWAWYLMRRAELAKEKRDERLEDAVLAMGVNQLELAGMVQRLLHPDKPTKKDNA